MTTRPPPQPVPPINVAVLQAGLPGLNIHCVESLPSTQSAVSSNSLLVTEHQSAGVGRRGNQWLTPAGRSVCLSYRYPTPLPMAQMAGYSVVMALATLQALQHHQADVEVSLKWPNDLLFQGQKFAGILVNLQPGPSRQNPSEVIVGIGINWCLTAEQLASVQQPVCNVPLTQLPARDAFIVTLIQQINQFHQQFIQQGLTPMLRTWDQHDAFRDRPIRLITAQGEVQGTCQGLNPRGELLLQTNQGIKHFSSGEVSLRAL